MTESLALVGTLAYMAPEQVRGEAADARSDLWSAGLVEDGYDIHITQEPLGHKEVSTTMIHTHDPNRGGRSVRSPLDGGV